MNESEESKNDREVIQYFESLGYKTSWDWNKREGIAWNEIIHPNGKLICQIDAGVPLNDIIEDFSAWHEQRESTSKSDYDVAGPESPELTELFKKVSESKITEPTKNYINQD